MIRRFETLGAVGLVGLLASAAAAGAPAEVTSDFDDGFQGWTSTVGVGWQAAGGNPGGYVRFVDSGPAEGGQLFAPAAYLGDWTAYEGGTISFDFKVFVTSPPTFDRVVRLSGPGGVVQWRDPSPAEATEWLHFDVPIEECHWIVIEGTWAGVLADVTELMIYMPDSSTAVEETGVDSVRLSTDAACLADLNNTGNVDVTDLLALLAAWGPCAECGDDIVCDDEVNVQDLLALLAAWGDC